MPKEPNRKSPRQEILERLNMRRPILEVDTTWKINDGIFRHPKARQPNPSHPKLTAKL